MVIRRENGAEELLYILFQDEVKFDCSQFNVRCLVQLFLSDAQGWAEG